MVITEIKFELIHSDYKGDHPIYIFFQTIRNINPKYLNSTTIKYQNYIESMMNILYNHMDLIKDFYNSNPFNITSQKQTIQFFQHIKESLNKHWYSDSNKWDIDQLNEYQECVMYKLRRYQGRSQNNILNTVVTAMCGDCTCCESIDCINNIKRDICCDQETCNGLMELLLIAIIAVILAIPFGIFGIAYYILWVLLGCGAGCRALGCGSYFECIDKLLQSKLFQCIDNIPESKLFQCCGGCNWNGGDETTRNIEVSMRIQKQIEDQHKKILLIGSGASGKATLFKQIKDINPSIEELDKQRSDKESAKEEAKHVIRMNLIVEMATLIARGMMYHHDNPDGFMAVTWCFLFLLLSCNIVFCFVICGIYIANIS